ncbi:MAG: flagellar hook-length control protein FliK [Selenomonas sp.]|nr:flagellar hook-length control protein FliK [Selenomonas sp.]
MNNVQIMSTSPQAGTSKVSVKSTSVSKTAKSSGFDDVLQRSQAQDAKASAQDVKSAVSDARDAAESAADETEASAAAAAAEKNPAAAKTKAKGKDAKQGTKNDDASDVKDDAAAITDDGTDILAEAAQAALDAKLVLAQAVVGNENGVQDVTVTAAETAGSVEDIAQALLDASSSTPSAQSSLQTLVPQDASKGQAQKAMLAMLSGQNVETEAASDMTAATTQQAPQAQNLQNAVQMPQTQTSASMQQLLAQMSPVTDASQTSQQSLAELQSLSSLNTANLAQQAQTLSQQIMQAPQMETQAAASAAPLFQQAAASTNDTQSVKTSDFANLLGTDVTHASASDLSLTQQVVATPQNGGSSLGDFLNGGSQSSGQAMAEMLQTSDGTVTVTQLPEEAAFDKAPTAQGDVPAQAGTLTSFSQTLSSIDGTQASQSAQAAQQPQTDYDVPQQIVDQARLIQRGQDTEMVIHLKPEHLGDLTLRVSVGVDGAVNASFHSNNAEVRTIIENTLVQLKQDLNDQGIKVDNVGVYAGLADGGLPQDSGQQSWQQQSSQGQHHSTQESAEAFEDGQELAAALAAQKEGNAATDGVDYRV